MVPFILGGIGAGDIKLLGVVGAFKGSPFAINTFLWMALWGGALALVLLLVKGRLLAILNRLGQGVLMAGLAGLIKKDRGQARVEVALVIPILLLLFAGICEFGHILGAYMVINNLAREGARYGAVGHNDLEIENLVLTQRAWLDENKLTVYISPEFAARHTGEPLDVKIDYSVDLMTGSLTWLAVLVFMGFLIPELHLRSQEKRRREALRDMANRVNVDDVSTFLAAIIQADQLGVSITNVPRLQSRQVRNTRRMQTEEKAQKAPVKILLPRLLFIFPTILIVRLGPAVIQWQLNNEKRPYI